MKKRRPGTRCAWCGKPVVDEVPVRAHDLDFHPACRDELRERAEERFLSSPALRAEARHRCRRAQA